MDGLVAKYIRLKTSVGGNREIRQYENSYNISVSELEYITPPSRANVRILSELDYALKLSAENGGVCEKELGQALDFLLESLNKNGTLTDDACSAAEEILAPLSPLAKSYKVLLTGHAHIDMNWMWSYQETVATTLATFRTMCNIMDEYPEFTYTQSQGSVYRIVEQYDPDLMTRIRKYIDEGRWEVVATSWVEPDKNMPSGESLLRHIEYTRNYMKEVWGVKDFEVDFVPDTFGHAITIPEIDAFGGVKYMYHCRGNDRDALLYRYQSPSGKEILVLREAHWYSGGVTPQIGSNMMELVRRSSGLKCIISPIGVGDHGGGPTRRDIERAIDMMQWPIYPTIEFGSMHQYFHEAEKIREKLPVVTEELGFNDQGCYTTQARIKRANRRAEAALYDTEALASLAEENTAYRLPRAQMELTWRDVLFTHFHDILTGSCIRDSREYAMGLYQTAACVTNTQLEKAMDALSKRINTAEMPVLKTISPLETADAAKYDSRSEGAGVGYGVENFTGVPAAERGSGLLRVYHIFNTLTEERTGVAELTVWDYMGDISRVQIQDADGNELPCQILDEKLQTYWDHCYFRVLVGVTVPAVGYKTVILREKAPEAYPVFLRKTALVSPLYDDYILDNGIVQAVIDVKNGRIRSLVDLASGSEMIAEGKTAGLTLCLTEKATSNAWFIGRTLEEIPVTKCVEIEQITSGALRDSIKATFLIEGGCRVPSKAEVTYRLDAGSRGVSIDIAIDWQEQGEETIPVLTWQTPFACSNSTFRYIIPAGTKLRGIINNDVPGIGGAAAMRGDGLALAVISDSKYGYRGQKETLDLTLINTSTRPDPYPERGLHNISLKLAVMQENSTDLQALTDDHCHAFFYQPGNVHEGTLPTEGGLVRLAAGEVSVLSVRPGENGEIVIRGYEASGNDGKAVFAFSQPVKEAYLTNLEENAAKEATDIKDCEVTIPVRKNALFELHTVLS